MNRTLKNVATADDYTGAATIEQRGISKLNITITNAAVIMQLAEPDGMPSTSWMIEEEFIVPSFQNRNVQCDGIRFKSAVAGTPARVSVGAS